MRYRKTEWGYIGRKKAAMLLGTLLFVAAIAAIYMTGYYLNGKSNASLWTVGAILLVLPAAKLFVSFVVLFPYRTPDRQRHEAAMRELKEGMELWSDLVITSREKVMNLDFLAIGHHHVIGLLGKRGQDLSYVEGYLSKGVRNYGDGFKVKVCEDEESFLKALRGAKEEADNEGEREKVKAYLRTLIA